MKKDDRDITEGLQTHCASDLEGADIPERQWLVKDAIPHENVALVSGDGGLGKTILVLMLGTSISAKTDWLGMECMQGPFLYIGAEDDKDELDRRIESMRVEMGLTHEDMIDFHYYSLAGEDALIATFDRGTQVIRPTPLLAKIEKRISDLGAICCVLDTSADMFGGEEINRSQVRQFVGMLRGVCLRQHCTIILLAHPSLSGLKNDTGMSGSTAWHNSVRARIYLKDDGGDHRLLEFKKSNYSAKGEPMRLAYRNGIFVIDDGRATESANANAELMFLQMIDLYNAQDRPVCATRSSNYAPTIFSRDPMCRGINMHVLQEAMNSLFAKQRIMVESYGPPSKQRKRIVRK